MARRSQRYSWWSLWRQSRRGAEALSPAWRKGEPQPRYDAVIVGASLPGLATAYYLARRHRMRKVAVVEAGAVGAGLADLSPVLRSDAAGPAWAALLGTAHAMYEDLSQELGFNIQASTRGLLDLAFDRARVELLQARADDNTHAGIKSWMIPPSEVLTLAPLLATRRRDGAEIEGALFQPRGGLARPEAVAFAYARAADRLGVDIIENCPTLRVLMEGEKAAGVETARGVIAAPRVLIACGRSAGRLAAGLGLLLPLLPRHLQGFVTAPVKPALGPVLVFGDGRYTLYQGDRGSFHLHKPVDARPPSLLGADARRAALAAVDLLPALSRLDLTRPLTGAVNGTPDGAPLFGPSGIEGLWLSCGWGDRGFAAVPGAGLIGAFALAEDKPHRLMGPFSPARLARRALPPQAEPAATLAAEAVP